jgi:steroid 5-alpha reductase family enzyme
MTNTTSSKNLSSVLTIVAATALAAAVAWTGGKQSPQVAGVPLVLLCAVFAFSLQWLAFIPAFILQTEKFYDLVGCVTYLSVLSMVAWLGPALQTADLLLLAMCAVWALRLGLFLSWRIHKDGSDKRFNDIKPRALRFLMAWSLQGLWVFLTLSAVLIVVSTPGDHSISAFTVVGGLLWLAGFVVETVADAQKRAFKADTANKGRFIQSGLWARSRHPNYVGEITLWVGVFVCAIPQLTGWQWVAVISPLFIILLLTKVSGVPMLEASADKQWGNDAAYQAYKRATPVLWPVGR